MKKMQEDGARTRVVIAERPVHDVNGSEFVAQLSLDWRRMNETIY